MFPSISLAIPVFNESHTIVGTIANIKYQSFKPEEIILLDGGSTDNTEKILQEYTGREKWVAQKKYGSNTND